MSNLRSTVFILLGIVLAVFAAVRAAPDLVQAFSVLPGENEATRIILPGRQADGPPGSVPNLTISRDRSWLKNAIAEPIAGLSPSFTARSASAVPITKPITPTITIEQNEPGGTVRPANKERLELTDTHPMAEQIPIRLRIPSINLDAPVVPAVNSSVKLSGKEYEQWLAPEDYSVGWHDTSALLGVPGNTVLNGHHNLGGEVFRDLENIKVGDSILAYSEDRVYVYIVTNNMILPEKYVNISVRMENARWILQSEDERLTLITCWPYTSNTHRLIIVARPK
jgi:LPXTG-site transpeptidase (sortase) family protein